ncbi:MAG: hypothetical protein DMG36_16980 [Acidobacteria bacterium]|nr:MAG: hypothetical protein DMG36_16980 [Acidobacteriota bacterium]
MEEYTEDWKFDCNGEERRPLPTPVLLDRYQNKGPANWAVRNWLKRKRFKKCGKTEAIRK